MMNVDVILVERLCQSVPYKMLVDHYGYDDEQIENAVLYLRSTPLQEVDEMLEEARFLRECDENELCD